MPIVGIIFLLFFPAALGLVIQGVGGQELTHQLLALALAVSCIEQARMAVVDLQQVKAVQQQIQDQRLTQFHQVTLGTIGLELVGYYGAIGWLGWGTVLVLVSQLGFNLLAGIQLHSALEAPIQPWGVRERLPVIIADVVGLILVGCWMANIAPLIMVTIVSSMFVVYAIVKYGPASINLILQRFNAP